MLEWFKSKKPDEKIETATFQKKIAIFKTVDGETHRSCDYKWCRVSGITCSVENFLMDFIIKDGYIKDDKYVMYPLTNIISIKWELVAEIEKPYPQREFDFNIFVSDEFVDSL